MTIIGVPRNKTADELRETPTWVICEHGQSQRSCPHCEVNAQADEIAALKERVSVLESTLAHAITEVSIQYDSVSEVLDRPTDAVKVDRLLNVVIIKLDEEVHRMGEVLK